MRPRHRLSNLLLRHGLVWEGKNAWTGAHQRWLRQVRAEQPWSAGTRSAFDAGYETVVALMGRRDQLDDDIAAMAADGEFTPIARWLGCLPGVATLTGFALAVEIGDWTRLSGASIGASVGLTPSEHSCGTSRSLRQITRTGIGPARQAADRSRLAPPTGLPTREDHARPMGPRTHDGASAGRCGSRRLHRQWLQFPVRKKRGTIATVAVARELAGWCWSLASSTSRTPRP